MIKNSTVVSSGCWNTMAAVMPVSSTTRFSETIGKGMPRHVGDDEDVSVDDMMARYLFVIVDDRVKIKKAGSDIQNRLERLYVLHETMSELQSLFRYPFARIVQLMATAAAAHHKGYRSH